MYSPQLTDDTIRALYRVCSATGQPMTKVADGMIRKSLVTVNKHAVCEACAEEGIADCANCILAGSVTSKSA